MPGLRGKIDGCCSFLSECLWFVLGGIISGICWWLAGIIAAITIIGLPWARACFRIGSYTFFPFGRDVISVKELYGESSGTAGFFRFIGNVIWFIPLGFILMVIHLIAAVACFITIIGIPFGYAHLKLAGASIFPLGKRVVRSDVATLARNENAVNELAKLRGRA